MGFGINSLLIKSNRSSLATSATLVALSKHFNKFLSSYAGAMGKVAAGLTGGAIVGLLYHTGAGKDVIDAIWGHLKLPK
jgi:ABC-type Na+ transport system ATPase subunit NatA